MLLDKLSCSSKNLAVESSRSIWLLASKNRLPDLTPLIPEVQKLLNAILPGEVIEVGLS